MNNYLIRFNSILWISVITSICIHIAFFSFFILSFPVKFQSYQPYLISLGAIIPHQDLFREQSNDRLQTNGKFQFLPSYPNQEENFPSLRQVEKPLDQKSLKLNGKIIQKSIFPTAKQSTVANETEFLKLKNNPDPYQPLQIP